MTRGSLSVLGLTFSLAAVGCSQPRAQGAESFEGSSTPQIGQATLQLPGLQAPSTVTFHVINGMAVTEGDILLGPPAELMSRYGATVGSFNNSMSAVAVKDRSYLWSAGDIPYEFDGTITNEKAAEIQSAAQEAASAGLKLRPKQFGDSDYLVFHDSGESWNCSSYIGRIGGAQTVNVAGCGRGSILHEILHAAGFHHEQSRGDRDQYITIMWDDIQDSERTHFEMRGASAQDIGPYDYASIMHYGRTAFSKTGRPTIIPKSPEAPIGQRDGLSQLDRAAIGQLYGGGGGSVGGGGFPGFPGIPGLPGIPGFTTEPTQGTTQPGTQNPGAPVWTTPFGTVPAPIPMPTQGGSFPVPGGQLPTLPPFFQ